MERGQIAFKFDSLAGDIGQRYRLPVSGGFTRTGRWQCTKHSTCFPERETETLLELPFRLGLSKCLTMLSELRPQLSRVSRQLKVTHKKPITTVFVWAQSKHQQIHSRALRQLLCLHCFWFHSQANARYTRYRCRCIRSLTSKRSCLNYTDSCNARGSQCVHAHTPCRVM